VDFISPNGVKTLEEVFTEVTKVNGKLHGSTKVPRRSQTFM